MPQNPQNKICQTVVTNYNKSRSVRTEVLRWLKITTDTGMKLKVETTVKEIYQQLLEFINIDVINIEQQHTSSQCFITLTMYPIINRLNTAPT